ncbi:MAG: RAMP superfamily CRISPR-associated protein [Ignavibacteria bacterium]|nr:RAMP superfamily CRISPR-associated protein [Ignavibacteria bacterium]
MKTLKVTLELLSDTLSGSGEGFGAMIDTDVQYDEFGIPFISAKRIKGCLKNSLHDLLEMPAVSDNKFQGQSEAERKESRKEIIEKVFGKAGAVNSTSFAIGDFLLEDHEAIKTWFAYLIEKYPGIFSSEKILSAFTNTRKQTKIGNDEVAEPHSLRTSRVVNRGIKLETDICFEEEDKEVEGLLALSCANLRRIGTKRNRGLGDVRCELIGDIVSLAINDLEKSTLRER